MDAHITEGIAARYENREHGGRESKTGGEVPLPAWNHSDAECAQGPAIDESDRQQHGPDSGRKQRALIQREKYELGLLEIASRIQNRDNDAARHPDDEEQHGVDGELPARAEFVLRVKENAHGVKGM
jgi:hypothetical protein